MAIDRGHGIVTPAVLADSYDLDGILAKYEEFDDLYLGKKSVTPTTDDDGDPLQAGALYFDTVISDIFVYNGTQWNKLGSTSLQLNNFTGNGSRTVYGLTLAPLNENSTQVYIDGVYQHKDTYSVLSKNVTFSVAPSNGSNIDILISTSFDVGETDAPSVSYDQGSTGSVARTVQDKLQESVSVKDFGVVGDGITDDTTEAQAFLDYLSTNGGKGIINCPLRVSTLQINNNTKPFVVEWLSDNCTLSANTKATPLVFDTCTNITLITPRVDGRASEQGATTEPDTYHGIKLQDCTDVYVYRPYIENYNGSAMLIMKNITAPLRNFVIDGYANAGGVGDNRNGFIVVDANECELINCVVEGAVSFALELKNDCERCAIRGGSVTNSGAAVYCGQVGATAPGVGGVSDSIIEGVTAYNVDQGYVGGYTRNVHVDIAVLDQTTVPGYQGADMGCRFVNSEDSTVRIREFKGDVEVAQFFNSSNRCNVIIDNMESESNTFVDYQSTCSNNHVEIKRAAKDTAGTYTEYESLRDKLNDLGTSNSFDYKGGFKRTEIKSTVRAITSTPVTIDGATSTLEQDIINPVFTMGAGEFLKEGDELIVDISGKFTGTGVNKRLFLYFGSYTVYVISGITADEFFDCRFVVSSKGSPNLISSVQLLINGKTADVESQDINYINTTGSFDVILKGRLDAGAGNTITVNRCVATLIQKGT